MTWAAYLLPGDVPPIIPLFPEWYDDAACYGVDTDSVFFAERGNARAAIKEARMLCRPCPVREQCLQYAIDKDLRGIWGGTTRPQRHAIRKQHAPRDEVRAATA